MIDAYPYDFGKYRIEGKIGQGGFGTVFRAIDTTLRRPVAIKIMDPIYLNDRKWVENFRQEAIMMARLEHPNIVPIHEMGEREGRIFLAMRLIDGPNLAQYLRERGPFSWDGVVGVMQQVGAALDHAHAHGVLHRDLKPANILLAGTQASLTDFGLAQLVETNTMSVSIHGGLAGTYQYMAPELFNDAKAVSATDIYSLGCILYEMVTSEVLFDGASTAAIITAHLRPLQLPSQIGQQTPPQLRAVLRKALAKDPAERYQTAGEFVEALTTLAADELAQPYAAVEKALAARDWKRGLQLADQIAAEDPGYREIGRLRAAAREGLENAQRAQAASRWQQQARAALAKDDAAAAQAALHEWRAVAPDDRRLPALEAELALLRQYRALRQSLAEERWQEAVSRGEAITSQNPGYRDAAALLSRARRELESGQRILAGQWRDVAEEALQAAQWENALAAALKWQSLAPEDPAAVSAVTRARAGKARAEEEAKRAKHAWQPVQPAPAAPKRVPRLVRILQLWLLGGMAGWGLWAAVLMIGGVQELNGGNTIVAAGILAGSALGGLDALLSLIGTIRAGHASRRTYSLLRWTVRLGILSVTAFATALVLNGEDLTNARVVFGLLALHIIISAILMRAKRSYYFD